MLFRSGVSGLILWLPNLFSQFLPGEALNVAKIIHSEEALLATSFIFAIHFFGTHFRPEKFPMDMSILSGLVSDQELREERPEFLERLRKEGKLAKLETTVVSRGRLLAIATGYAAALLVIVAVMLGGQAGGLEGTVRTALGEVLSIYVPTLGEAERTAAASLWAETFPAMVAGSWLLTLTVNGGLAQAILARSGRGLRPTPRYAEIEAPNWVMGAIAVSALVWLVAGGTTGYVARSLTLVFAIPLFFQGLGVAHVVTRGWPARPFVLTVFYTLILFLPRWSGLAMATGVGLIESLIGLRRRFAAPAADEEED